VPVRIVRLGSPRKPGEGLRIGTVRYPPRDRLTAALTVAGWSVGPSETNFLLIDFGTPERSAATAEDLLSRGLVPRTFPAGHPLAAYLRLTVRDRHENDRVIEAAGQLSSETRA